jgi:hypothetical protein
MEAGVGLAFVTPVASYLLYATVAVIWFAPDRRLTRLEGEGGSGDRAGKLAQA